jgi:hypothetical protein
MKSEFLAPLQHCVSTDEVPRHNKCAKGEDSWCFYNRPLAKEEIPGSHKSHLTTRS